MVIRDCGVPSFNMRLPCDIYILGGSSGYFLGFFLLDWSFRLSTARAPVLIFFLYLYLLALKAYSFSINAMVIGIRVGIRVVVSLKKSGLMFKVRKRGKGIYVSY